MSKAELCETLTLIFVSRYREHCFWRWAHCGACLGLARGIWVGDRRRRRMATSLRLWPHALTHKQNTSLHFLINGWGCGCFHTSSSPSIAHHSAKVTSLICSLESGHWHILGDSVVSRLSLGVGMRGSRVPRVTAPVSGGVRVFRRSRGAWVLAVEGIDGVNTPP